ncbi:MAG: hypothetical protein ABW023_08725 [Sphingomonas sp.]
MSTPPTKAARMELRRAIDNREVSGPPVRPYNRGPAYLIAHACFDCRKSWKRPDADDHVCPECRKPLARMGRSFRAPRKASDDQWEKVRILWKAGFRFWSYRSCRDAESLPDELRDVEDFIRRNPHHPMRARL